MTRTRHMREALHAAELQVEHHYVGQSGMRADASVAAHDDDAAGAPRTRRVPPPPQPRNGTPWRSVPGGGRRDERRPLHGRGGRCWCNVLDGRAVRPIGRAVLNRGAV